MPECGSSHGLKRCARALRTGAPEARSVTKAKPPGNQPTNACAHRTRRWGVYPAANTYPDKVNRGILQLGAPIQPGMIPRRQHMRSEINTPIALLMQLAQGDTIADIRREMERRDVGLDHAPTLRKTSKIAVRTGGRDVISTSDPGRRASHRQID
jgi:hypothetical protein